jgi:hypothetical protein
VTRRSSCWHRFTTASSKSDSEVHKQHGWLHRNAIPTPSVRQAIELLDPGEAAVLARGAEGTVDAVGARVRALTGGDMRTYDLAEGGPVEVTGTQAAVGLIDHEGLLREASDEVPLQNSLLVRVPFS